jgi:hypothetical protein
MTVPEVRALLSYLLDKLLLGQRRDPALGGVAART